jgi:hypothetical protein
MARFHGAPVIEHPDRYDAAISARIKANATQTRRAKWFAADQTRHDLEHWLMTEARGSFAHKMAENLSEWGHLTEGQEAAVRKMRGEAVAKRTQWAEQDAQSAHVGTVGKREVFTGLVLISAFEDEGPYGLTVAHKFRDAGGNLFHWKTSRQVADKGEVLTLKATVKAHHVNKAGVKSTILTRAAVEETLPGEPQKRAAEKAAAEAVEAEVRKAEGQRLIAAVTATYASGDEAALAKAKADFDAWNEAEAERRLRTQL